MSRSLCVRTVSVTSCALLLAVAIANGCASDARIAFGDDLGPDGAPLPSGDLGLDGSQGSSGSGGPIPSGGGNPDGSLPDVEFVYIPPVKPPGDACAVATETASLKKLDMYVILDRSTSMAAPQVNTNKGDCNIGETVNSRWCKAINALSSYFNSPVAAGHAAALNFFPINNFCDGTGYTTAYIPSGNGFYGLPTTQFNATLNAVVLAGATPTEAALRGIIGFTSNGVNQRAGRITTGILVTDGDPVGCDTNINVLAGLLQNHYLTYGLQTFIVGMAGANFSNLEAIAAGGNAPLHADNVGSVTNACGDGPGPCRHWNIGEGDGNALAEAMKQIQGFAIACQYSMPVPQAGAIDPNDVVVEYWQNGVQPAKTLTRVTGAGACVADGWYYDDNASPSTIQLCPAQCTAVRADENAKINLMLGCLDG